MERSDIVKKKIYILILLITVIFTNACSKSSNIKEVSNTEKTNITVENEIDSSQEQNSSQISKEKEKNITSESKGTPKESNNTPSATKKEEYTTNDKSVINYFNSVDQKVDEILKEEKSETVKDKLKGTFITIVDFIFYDSEIQGIKFNDLTDGAKQNILDTAAMIDSKIITKYPNYKDEISTKTKSAYKKASELIKKGSVSISEFSKDKLGEDNYNAIIEAKDELVYYSKNAVSLVGKVTGSIFNKTKSKIKNWYENLKS